jgi:hypothetical protein
VSDNPQRLTRFDADGAREPMRHPQLVSLAYADHRRWAFYNIGAMMCAFDTGRMHGPEQGPTFTPTDRQRRRIAGARAYVAQRLTVAYSGQLDTGRLHGPASDSRGIDCGCGWGTLCDTGSRHGLCDCRPHHGGAHR